MWDWKQMNLCRTILPTFLLFLDNKIELLLANGQNLNEWFMVITQKLSLAHRLDRALAKNLIFEHPPLSLPVFPFYLIPFQIQSCRVQAWTFTMSLSSVGQASSSAPLDKALNYIWRDLRRSSIPSGKGWNNFIEGWHWLGFEIRMANAKMVKR